MAGSVIAAQLYTVREHVKTIPDIAETLRKVNAIGYTSVQISAFGPVDARELATVIEDSGVTIASTHTGWDRFRDEIDTVIEEHTIWGCSHPAIGGVPAPYFEDGGLERFVEELGPVADALKAAGVEMIWDCQRGECGLCAVDILELDGEIDHRDVFFSDAEKAEGKHMCACVSRLTGGHALIDTGYRGA